jgi:PBP1b-binding outer membrane lipoprotein LpoB
MKHYLFLLLSAFLLYGCNNSSKHADKDQTTQAAKDSVEKEDDSLLLEHLAIPNK